MSPKISLTRSPTAKAPELRLPAIMYDHVFALWATPGAANKEVTASGVAFMSCEARRVKRDRRSLIVSLTAGEYFALGELASEIGISSDDLMYCGYRILAGSRDDSDVVEDCLEMLKARGS